MEKTKKIKEDKKDKNSTIALILSSIALGLSIAILGVAIVMYNQVTKVVKTNSSNIRSLSSKVTKLDAQINGVPEYDVSMFKNIDTDKFIELFKKDEKSFIYLGRSTCGYCVQFLPSLQKAQEEYGYKTYYLDITTVSDKGMKKIQKLDKFLKNNYGYTPLVLVVKNGKILNKEVDGYEGVGYTEYKTFEKFLKKLDYEKK